MITLNKDLKRNDPLCNSCQKKADTRIMIQNNPEGGAISIFLCNECTKVLVVKVTQ